MRLSQRNVSGAGGGVPLGSMQLPSVGPRDSSSRSSVGWVTFCPLCQAHSCNHQRPGAPGSSNPERCLLVSMCRKCFCVPRSLNCVVSAEFARAHLPACRLRESLPKKPSEIRSKSTSKRQMKPESFPHPETHGLSWRHRAYKLSLLGFRDTVASRPQNPLPPRHKQGPRELAPRKARGI